MFGDSFYKKVEQKSGVGKSTILELAQRIQNSNMKDENVLKDVIHQLSSLTGKEVSKEKEQKIIDTIINDNVPKNVDKMF